LFTITKISISLS